MVFTPFEIIISREYTVKVRINYNSIYDNSAYEVYSSRGAANILALFADE